MSIRRAALGLIGIASMMSSNASEPTQTRPADLVVTGGRIYTEDPARSTVEAMAVLDGKIVYLGTTEGVKPWIGARTDTRRMGGRLVIPGLVDAHIHASMIADLDVCDLKSVPKSLREIAAFAKNCLKRYKIPDGEWLVVQQWDYARGNQTNAEYPTLRAALDKASTTHPIEIIGNDGHHSAFNSAALAKAKNDKGAMVGLSKATLKRDFPELKAFVGVDEQGEPSGAVNEDARDILDRPDWLLSDLPAVMKAPERVTQRLNSVGITAILDALVPPGLLKFYDALSDSGHLTVRALLAQYYDPEKFKRADGSVDYDSMVAQATAVRSKYAVNPLIRADMVKLVADGGLEGNPYAIPPTMPNAAALRPFYQPIFGKDSSGKAVLTGYVYTSSPFCKKVRADSSRSASAKDIAKFLHVHGFHPHQCDVTSGRLSHSRAVILEFVRRFHMAGFALHIHAISDLTLRTSLDAIEAARAADGVTTLNDVLAHVQLAHPDDVVRIGRDHLFVAFTYEWAYTDPQYDLTVIPFIDHVADGSYQAMHLSGGYYDANAYPFRGVKNAGGILVAGSDAPVDTPDPRPFINMTHAMTRQNPGQPPLNPAQSISIRDVLDAYTINGARSMGREKEFGSLELGKSADFAVLDQDILDLADKGHPERVADTRVVGTWFQGRQVYGATD